MTLRLIFQNLVTINEKQTWDDEGLGVSGLKYYPKLAMQNFTFDSLARLVR